MIYEVAAVVLYAETTHIQVLFKTKPILPLVNKENRYNVFYLEKYFVINKLIKSEMFRGVSSDLISCIHAWSLQ